MLIRARVILLQMSRMMLAVNSGLPSFRKDMGLESRQNTGQKELAD